MKRQLLKYEDLEQLLNVQRATLYSWVCRGELPFIRLGRRAVRFDPAEIEQWMKSRRDLTCLSLGEEAGNE